MNPAPAPMSITRSLLGAEPPSHSRARNPADAGDRQHGVLGEVEAEVRALVKAEFSGLKEKVVKELLAEKTWRVQRELLGKAKALQAEIGTGAFRDFQAFEAALKLAEKASGVKLEAKEKKQLVAAVSWTDPEAEPVVKKVVKGKANARYGAFGYGGKVVEFQPDSALRDSEDVPLAAETARGAGVDAVNEAYFEKEVAPHVADAWIDAGKKDGRDGEIGVVGYEIPFNRHFYVYEPPRELAVIDAELEVLSGEIMGMLKEVRG